MVLRGVRPFENVVDAKLRLSFNEEEGQAESLTRLITEIHDQITCRLIEQGLGEMEKEGRGGTPSEFSWMGMGSEGRREQTVITDQDNALIFKAF